MDKEAASVERMRKEVLSLQETMAAAEASSATTEAELRQKVKR